MSILKEFKEFAMRGNVVDMAVGIVIGAAFGKIVTSLVNDVIMPPIGALGRGRLSRIGSSKFPSTGKRWRCCVTGPSLSTVLDFLIVAVAIFAVVKLMNMVRHQPPAAPPVPPPPTKEEVLLTEIRDLLKTRS